MPGKRGVAASVNSTAIFGLGTIIAGAGGAGVPPSVATGTGRLISLPCGKSLEDKQVVHRSVAELPQRGAGKTHRPLLVAAASVSAVCLYFGLTMGDSEKEQDEKQAASPTFPSLFHLKVPPQVLLGLQVEAGHDL